MADDDSKAGLTDAAVGTGAGALVAVAVPTIYGMTQLKNADPAEIATAAFKESAEHGKKMLPIVQKVLETGPFKELKDFGTSIKSAQKVDDVIDLAKLKTSIEEILQKHNVNINLGELLGEYKDAGKNVLSNLGNADALDIYKELQKAVIEAFKVRKITKDQLFKIFSATRTAAKDRTKFGLVIEALKEGGINTDGIFSALDTAIEEHPAGAAIEKFTGLYKDTLEHISKLAPSLKPEDISKIKAELGEAVIGSAKIPVPEQLKKIIASNDPKAMTNELKSVVTKALDGNQDFKREAKGAFVSIDSAARKILGSVKYQNAPLYAKPFVAFEAMPIKGQVALGAAVITTTALATVLAASKRHGSHADAAQSAGGQQTQI